MDVLVQMRNHFDKPEDMANLKSKLPGERGEEVRDHVSEQEVGLLRSCT